MSIFKKIWELEKRKYKKFQDQKKKTNEVITKIGKALGNEAIYQVKHRYITPDGHLNLDQVIADGETIASEGLIPPKTINQYVPQKMQKTFTQTYHKIKKYKRYYPKTHRYVKSYKARHTKYNPAYKRPYKPRYNKKRKYNKYKPKYKKGYKQSYKYSKYRKYRKY